MMRTAHEYEKDHRDMQMNLTLSYFDEDRVLEMDESKKDVYEAVTEKKRRGKAWYRTSMRSRNRSARSVSVSMTATWSRPMTEISP